jgi:hypothetical protein
MDVAIELAAAAELVGGKAWGADKGKPRIYLQTPRKDVSVFFDFPEASAEKDWGETSCLGTPIFKCFIDAPDQPGTWYREQKEQLRSTFRPQHLALIANRYGYEEAAKEMASLATLPEEEFTKIAALLDNGKPDDAIAAAQSVGAF